VYLQSWHLVFSEADYALAARLMGLPMPTTPAEQAAAAPVTARVLRDFLQMRPPSAGMDDEFVYTGATRSLNAYPDTEYPMQKAQLASRLRVEQGNPMDDPDLAMLMDILMQNPEIVDDVLELLRELQVQGQMQMDELSSQRPPAFDMPNEGANYSMLNAPCSGPIPPSHQYQQLS